jgi:hypothetical protein
MSLALISDIMSVSGGSALRGAPNEVSEVRACRVWRSAYIRWWRYQDLEKPKVFSSTDRDRLEQVTGTAVGS